MNITEFFYFMFGFQILCVICEFICIYRDDGMQKWIVWGMLATGFAAVYDLIAIVDYWLRGYYRDLGASVFSLVFNLAIIYIFWRMWRHRKKVLKALGAKSKELRDKLVRKLREVTQPSPVRVPS